MPDFNKDHLRLLSSLEKELAEIFRLAINKIANSTLSVPYNGQLFSLRNYPRLRDAVQKQLLEISDKSYVSIVNSIISSWELSNIKNDLLVSEYHNVKKWPKH